MARLHLFYNNIERKPFMNSDRHNLILSICAISVVVMFLVLTYIFLIQDGADGDKSSDSKKLLTTETTRPITGDENVTDAATPDPTALEDDNSERNTDETKEPDETQEPDESKGADDTKEPVTTDTPDDTQVPSETEKAIAPAGTKKPSASAAPKPAATSKPVPTDTATKKPSFNTPGDTKSVSNAKIDEYYSDAVFIGDSVMYGFDKYCMRQKLKAGSFLGNPIFLDAGSYSARSALKSVNTAGTVHPKYKGRKVQLWDAVTQIQPKRVFLFFGLNDIGINKVSGTYTNYLAVIDKLRDTKPDLEICIISTTPMYKGSELKNLNNKNINALNAKMQDWCDDNDYAYYVDIAGYLKDKDGCLSKKYCSDSYVHQTTAAYEIWIQVLREFAATRILESEPQPTKAPEKDPSAKPETTPSPSQSAKPAASSKPVNTDTPLQTQKPADTDEPVTTDKPISTDKPVGTDKPENTGEPAGTEEPVSTDEPVNTDEPVSTDEPSSTNEPE